MEIREKRQHCVRKEKNKLKLSEQIYNNNNKRTSKVFNKVERTNTLGITFNF